jgi:hypothetical protein
MSELESGAMSPPAGSGGSLQAIRGSNDESSVALHKSYGCNDDEMSFVRDAHSYLPSKLSESI